MKTYLDWLKYPFVRYTAYLIIGILLGSRYQLPSKLWLAFIPLLLCLSLILFKNPLITGLSGLFFFVGLGWIVIFFTSLDTHRNLYINSGAPSYYVATTQKYEGNSTQYRKYLAKVNAAEYEDEVRETSGDVLLYISDSSSLTPGDIILISGSWIVFEKPKNPNVFNYAGYMRSRGVFAMDFIDTSDYLLIGHIEPDKITMLISELRERSIRSINKITSSKEELGVLKALLVGTKSNMDSDIKQNYADAGAIHVLAVSGLHVGIIYLFFSSLLVRIPTIKKNYTLQNVLIITTIWFYAAYTGLSPSVVRAATMFSLFCLANSFTRSSSIYNTLAFAAFCMLLINPGQLFDVGFQLSFIAVLGIVFFQPKVYKLFYFRYWFLDKLWELTSVGIAAQMATFPLGLFYFNQFPVYFFLSNLVVIPMAMMVVSLGSLFLLLAETGLVGWLGEVLKFVVSISNKLIIFISELPNSVLRIYSVDSLSVIIIYLFILSIILLLTRRRFIYILYSFILALAILFTDWLEKKSEDKIIVYSMKKGVSLDFYSDMSLIKKDLNSDPLEVKYQLSKNRLKEAVQQSEASARNIDGKATLTVLGNKSFIVLSSPLKLDKVLQVDYVILTREYASTSIDNLKFQNVLISPGIRPWVKDKIISDYGNKLYDLESGYLEMFNYK